MVDSTVPEHLAQSPLEAVVRSIAARTPTPGGGAAAALSAALGCAAGAMAARFTTGERWKDQSDAASALAARLDQAAQECTELADADAIAYAAVGRARKVQDTGAIAHAELRSAAVPERLLELCALQVAALQEFRSRCNPQLLSDVEVAIAILVGAGRAAASTLWVNRISPQVRQEALARLAVLAGVSAETPRGPNA